VRIIGGARRGLQLADVGAGDPAAHLRPTSDRVREAIFNLLINGGYGDPITDARVLDLFAGTGALGLEALSRGAAQALFVDDGSEARALLRVNIEALGVGGVTRVFRRDARKLGVMPPGAAHTLAFLDPPYGRGLAEPALAALADGGWLAPGALVVVEEDAAADLALPARFTPLDRRKAGDTQLVFARFG